MKRKKGNLFRHTKILARFINDVGITATANTEDIKIGDLLMAGIGIRTEPEPYYYICEWFNRII